MVTYQPIFKYLTVTSWKLIQVVWSCEEILPVRESYVIGTSHPTTWSTPVQSTHSRIVWIASRATTVHAELLVRQLQVQVSTEMSPSDKRPIGETSSRGNVLTLVTTATISMKDLLS